jgi:DNA primase
MTMLSNEQRASLASKVSSYQQQLAVDTAAQAYLTKRGIDPATAQRFALGVATSPLAGDERFQGRLVLPYLTPSGPVGLQFRCIQQHDCKEAGCKKYLKPSGQEGHLFNVAALKADSPFLVIAEGEIDTITWSMCGVPAVGLSGVKAWKKHFRYCLEDFAVIYSSADPDEAGRGLNDLLAREVRAIPLDMKGGDVNDHFRAGGREAVLSLLSRHGADPALH